MDNRLKIQHSIDALFGNGVSRNLPKKLNFILSKKNKRIKSVYHNEQLLCTLRIDGGLAITPHFARILLQNKKFKENCLEIDADSKPFVEDGRSVFCSHVLWCGKNVRIASDTPILFKDKIIAVGRAVLSSKMIPFMKKGVAVKVRNSLKS